MSKEVFVFEVSEKSFDKYVLLNSHKIPVLVEFMGIWSGPCVAVDVLLSDLAKEFAEQFIFCKVDMDEQPELLKKYNIENVPTLLVFQDGELKRREEGELKEKKAREILKDFGVFHESDLMREQARDKHMAGDTAGAIVLLSEVIKSDPSNTHVAMDMVQIFLDIGELEQANGLYARLPVSTQETEVGKALSGQLTFASYAAKTDDYETLQNRLSENINDHDARFDLAVHQIAQYEYNNAIDNLFYIQAEDAGYKEGAAKEMILTIANRVAAADKNFSEEIRRKLANLLAQ